ncbi:hypothetical protein OG871_40365 (plasmid) [Kitasatospora sp. NBC_00374]|uniref:hypothetical protein n=1 Tax=Kitasatospora sp. NBC_00374 TaxID=2975964 RepID=UPI002F916041
MTCTTLTPEPKLYEALETVLAEHSIPNDFWHTGGGYTALKVPLGTTEICITDVNAHVIEPLSEYSGIAVYFYPHYEHEGVLLYESPDLGIDRKPEAFQHEVASAVAAIQVCRRLAAAQTGITELDRREVLAPGQVQTRARLRSHADGQVTATVTSSFQLDREEIAAALVCHFRDEARGGRSLPQTLGRSELADILSIHAAPCPFGEHDQLPSADAETPLGQWVLEQLGALTGAPESED